MAESLSREAAIQRSEVQDQLTEGIVGLIQGCVTEETRIDAQTILEAVAAKLATPEGLDELKSFSE